MVRWLPLLALAACYRAPAAESCEIRCNPNNGSEACPSGLSCVTGLCRAAADTVCVDATIPGEGDGPLGEVCIGGSPGLMPEVCFDPPPTPPPIVVTTNIDTDADCSKVVNLPPPEQMTEVCVVAGAPLVIDAPLNVTGTRPLALWSAGSLVVGANAVIDAGSHGPNHPVRRNALGPAANDMSCPVRTALGFVGTGNELGGGGGAGGTFGAAGGPGGQGQQGSSGGIAPPTTAVVAFRGGCPGAFGGGGSATNPRSSGDGGGALYVMAETSIVISGVIDVSGAGSKAVLTHIGGGGGGSGGMLVFEAPVITLMPTARVLALGGGGGDGATAATGTPGDDPNRDPIVPAAASGTGGGGSLNGAGNTGTMPGTGGAGGGGGGIGIIYKFGALAVPDPNIQIHPIPTTP